MARIDDDDAGLRRADSSGPGPLRRRDATEGWAIGPDGELMWGRHGAAGLLAIDPARGVLLQHRADWNHFGGTWGIPGGALAEGESPIEGALREADEETAIDPAAVDPLFTRVRDLGFWRYTTLAAVVTRPVEVYPADAETADVAWLAPDEIDRLDLHPAFAEDWPILRVLARHRPALVIDVANVLGARGDGWWRDPAAAATRLLARCAALAADGLDAAPFGLDAQRVWPEVIGVLEGRGRDARLPDDPGARLRTVIAPGSGDDAIVETAHSLVTAEPERRVLVATSDRQLGNRLAEHGVGTVGGGRMRTMLERAGDGPPIPRQTPRVDSGASPSGRREQERQ